MLTQQNKHKIIRVILTTLCPLRLRRLSRIFQSRLEVAPPSELNDRFMGNDILEALDYPPQNIMRLCRIIFALLSSRRASAIRYIIRETVPTSNEHIADATLPTC